MEGTSCVSVGLLVLMFSFSLANLPHKRFEYKLSFKGPHLVQKDGSVPFWDYGGDAIASDDNIRITPSLRSKKGWVWSRNTMTQPNWMIEVTFRVTGRGRIGADGLAIWYTSERAQEGPVYGSKDHWKGLGIFFDSFDNDGLQNNPYIAGIINDGTQAYDHQRDGSTQMKGGCLRDFRNKPYPIRARIEYNKEILTVQVSNGMTNEPTGYEMCFQSAGLKIQPNGYFGVTAATGGLADDHDVMAFSTYSYTYPEVEQGKDSFSDSEREKYEKEYQEYQDQLKKAREEYQKEHPDAAKDEYDISEDKWFESQGERELNNIYVGQNSILDHIRNIDRKIDEIIGRQERMLSMVGQVGQGGQAGGNQGQAGMVLDTLTRVEVERLFSNQREISTSIANAKNMISEISRQANQPAASGGGGAGGGINNQLILHEIKDRLTMVKSDTENLIARPQGSGQPCPAVSEVNCLSPMYFYLFMAAQMLIFIGYSVYRQNKEAQAKKFY